MKKQTNKKTKLTNTQEKKPYILAMRVQVGLFRSTKKDNFPPVRELQLQSDIQLHDVQKQVGLLCE
jgi:hypothetical protein